jgi:hypothetical protein
VGEVVVVGAEGARVGSEVKGVEVIGGVWGELDTQRVLVVDREPYAEPASPGPKTNV